MTKFNYNYYHFKHQIEGLPQKLKWRKINDKYISEIGRWNTAISKAPYLENNVQYFHLYICGSLFNTHNKSVDEAKEDANKAYHDHKVVLLFRIQEASEVLRKMDDLGILQ